MLILRDDDVIQVLSSIPREDMLLLVQRFHDTLRQYTSEKTEASSPDATIIHQPAREVIATKQGNTSLFMPCSITTSTAVKVVTVSADGVKGCVNVFAPNGELLGLLNAEQLTAFRTSLAVMIPFQWYPQDKKKNVLVFGAGKQAEWHIQLALLLSDGGVENVTVVNRKAPRNMERLFASLKDKYPTVKFNVLLRTDSEYEDKLRSELAASDVIFCCTPALTPHFSFADLGPAKARFISLIGSYKPSMHEIDTETLRSGGRIFVDSKEDCLIESGELIDANVTEEELVEIGELDGKGPLGKENESLIFKCVGFAIMDIFMAQELLAMAARQGIGSDVPSL